MSFLANLGHRLSKTETAPVVRASRSGLFFGERTVMVYVPQGKAAGLQLLPLRSLEGAQIRIEEQSNEFLVCSDVGTHRVIATLQTQQEALAVLKGLSRAMAPSRGKWIWMALGVLLLAIVLSPAPSSRSPSLVAPAVATRPALPTSAYNFQAAGAGQGGSRVVPQQGVSGMVQSAAPSPMPPQTDVNDPFGLKIAPAATTAPQPPATAP